MWHKCFKDGQESVESDPYSGRPTTARTPENIELVQAAINKDHRLTVQELEAGLGMPKTTVSEISVQDLSMKCVMAKFVPWLLLPEQKEHRAAVGELCEVPRCLLRRGLRHHCPMYDISHILYLLQ